MTGLLPQPLGYVPFCQSLQKVQIVLRVVMRCFQKFLELRVRYRDTDRSRTNRSCSSCTMMAAWRIFPWVLHVHADIVETFDLDSVHPERKFARGNVYHSIRRFDAGDVLEIRTICWGRNLHSFEYCSRGHRPSFFISFSKASSLGSGASGRGEDRTEAVSLDGKIEKEMIAGDLRREFDAMPEIEIVHVRAGPATEARDHRIDLIAIHHRPEGLFASGQRLA